MLSESKLYDELITEDDIAEFDSPDFAFPKMETSRFETTEEELFDFTKLEVRPARHEPAEAEQSVPEEPVTEEIETKGTKNKMPVPKPKIGSVVRVVVVVLCAALTIGLLAAVAFTAGAGAGASVNSASDVTILDKFDMFMTNEISNALDGILSIKKVYWLSDSDLVAPEPAAEKFGTASDPSELMWLLEEASELIGDQEMLFGPDTPVWEGDSIYYYYDETILVIAWKYPYDNIMYTMAEVRIAHPTQFRRFLAGGEFGSDKQYVTTEMAASVNAVMASSGDFYKFRRNGAVVYEGQLRRFEGHYVDTCFINEDGDLLFAYRGDLTTEAEAQKFIEDNKVRFSLCFGPILVDNGELCTPTSYSLGEINGNYTRAALCQVDELHYLVVNTSYQGGYVMSQTIAQFAKNVQSLGVDKAYALDGGQTTVITLGDRMINKVDYGYQRQISDIIYFATAMPDGG